MAVCLKGIMPNDCMPNDCMPNDCMPIYWTAYVANYISVQMQTLLMGIHTRSAELQRRTRMCALLALADHLRFEQVILCYRKEFHIIQKR